MKTLNTLQGIFKAGKILSKIIFICCIVGFCLCVVGLASLGLGEEILRIGGVTLKNILPTYAGITASAMYAALAAGILLCAGEAVLSKFAEHYFTRALADGTPFTLDGARELKRLGILAICLPLGTQMVAQILHEVLAKSLTDVGPFALDNTPSAALGVMFLVLALVCQYGAELHGETQATEEVQ